MEPIGLTMKNIEYNHFTGRTSGELMIVHKCIYCGRISCNRIAGDDNPDEILKLLELQDRDNINNINFLNMNDIEEVLDILYGYYR